MSVGNSTKEQTPANVDEAAARQQVADRVIKAAMDWMLSSLYTPNAQAAENMRLSFPPQALPQSDVVRVWGAQPRWLAQDNAWGAIIKDDDAASLEIGSQVHMIVTRSDGVWQKAIGEVVMYEPAFEDPERICATVRISDSGPPHPADEATAASLEPADDCDY